MKKGLLLFGIIAVLLAFLCSCTEVETSSAITDDSLISSAADESSKVIESSEQESSFVSSEVSVDDPIELSDFAFTTDKTEYDYSDTIKLTLTIDSEYPIAHGEDYYVEYFDGEWKRCEIEYVWCEPWYEAKKETTVSFPLSERADKGREKYRVVFDVYDIVGKNSFTLYSNEFYIKSE